MTGGAGTPTPAGTAAPADGLPVPRSRTARSRVARSWPRLRAGEVAFALAGFPVALLGLAAVLLGTYAGALLALTVVGLPVIAGELRAARLTGRLHRGLLRSLLDVRIEAPAGIAASPTAVAWVRAGLADPAGWRTVGYLFVRFPLAVLGLLAAAGLPALGGLMIGMSVWLLTTQPVGRPPAWLTGLAVPAGLLVLLAVPWAVRGTTLLNVWAARQLLGPSRAQRELTDLRRARSTAIAEHTRSLRRIEQDLHDGTQAQLVAIAITLALVADSVDPQDERVRKLVGRAREQTDHTIAELRRLVHGIDPTALQDGLPAALRALGEDAALPVELSLRMPERAQPGIERVAYFCVVELLTNVVKHSGASEVRLDASAEGGLLRIAVTDDGRGGAEMGTGTGLAGLRERLASVDGTLTVDSPPGGPTRVEIRLPTSL
ncbi:histidine kinase [Planomonospora parontospora subsp. parontospora]|uniref:histidine kinase n=2 Tax=Planomonospora parontospora TaxID=58119 RepID=A0AA37BLD4_9ACTN|nr:sensor histidine kinase [Planomonospora parontospora]GGK86263.1 histidine kinase [Planomonospora parontospora]GII10864.1 histidine kinase [Planomonospora parontospora subsp. parontospora]